MVFDALRSWLRGSAPAAGPAPDTARAPVPPPEADGGWRDLAVQRLTLGAPELVSDPQGFGGSLASWRNPSLQRRLGHAVSADAPSGVVGGVLEPTPRPAPVQRWESSAEQVPPHGRPVRQAAGDEAAAATQPVGSVRAAPSVDESPPGIVTAAVAPVTPVAPVVVPLAPQQSLTVARATELPLRTLPVRTLPAAPSVTAPREAVPVQRVEDGPRFDPGPEPVAPSVDVEHPPVGERPAVEAGPADALAPVAPVAVQRPQDMGPLVGEERSWPAEHPVLPVIVPALPGTPRSAQRRHVVPEGPSAEPERAPDPVQHAQRVADDPLHDPSREERQSTPLPPVDPLDPPDARPEPVPELRTAEEAAADAMGRAQERPLLGQQLMTSVDAHAPAATEAPEPSVPPAPSPLSTNVPIERHVGHEVPAVQRLEEETPARVAERSAERPLVGEQPLSPAGAPPPETAGHAPVRRVGLGAPLPSVPGPAPVQRQEPQPPVSPGSAPAPRRPGLGVPLPAVPVPAHVSAPPSPPEPAVPEAAMAVYVLPEALSTVAQEPAAVPVPVQRQEEPLTVVRATPLQRAADEVPPVPEPGLGPEPMAGLVGERGLQPQSASVPVPQTDARTLEPAPSVAVPVTWMPSPASPVPVQRSVHAEPVWPRPAGTAAVPPSAVPPSAVPVSWAPPPAASVRRPEPVVPGPAVSAAVPSWVPPPVAAPLPMQRSAAPDPPAPVSWEPGPVPTPAPVQQSALPGPTAPVSWALSPAAVQRAPEPAPESALAPAPEPTPLPQQPPAQAQQQATAPAVPAPAAGGESTDELVRRLVGPLGRLLRAELRLDRERAGVRLDPRH
ncbi:hypothetical protein CGZ69_32795 [Streptomyces peucetius subsp. caesius ATCC 27952]|nr:hypothetical protein CGZ69_32795 [Streptomyces peucetius subsp. caesius ATCC 27952]